MLGAYAFKETLKNKLNIKQLIKPILVSSSIFCLIVSVIAVGYFNNNNYDKPLSSVNKPVNSIKKDSVSSSETERLATSVAADFAQQTDIPVAENVSNLSISLEEKQEITKTDDYVIVKPQVIQPESESRSIVTHKVKDGEDIPNIASQYNLKPETLKWANDISTDTVETDKVIKIPPVDGVIYKVKKDDNLKSIADKYKSTPDAILAFNDISDKVQEGRDIVIPDGVLPEDERPGYVSPEEQAAREARTRAAQATQSSRSRGGSNNESSFGASSNYLSASAGNAYAFGNCTWYVYEKRAQIGRPIGSFWGNASSWAGSASAAGFAVNGSPAPGAIMQNGGGYGGYGHVAIVDSVNSDGSITVSEMNYAGFNVVSKRTIPASSIGRYNFIH